jgi:hypothetical protein
MITLYREVVANHVPLPYLSELKADGNSPPLRTFIGELAGYNLVLALAISKQRFGL